MHIGIPKETHKGEKRVALTPDTAAQIQKLGHTLSIETGAGSAADHTDEAYREAGVEVLDDAAAVYDACDLIMKVRAPAQQSELGDEVALLRENTILLSFIWPAQNEELMNSLAERKVTVLAMDSVPRISRAQKLDALSSMANIGGYRAIVEAANQVRSFLHRSGHGRRQGAAGQGHGHRRGGCRVGRHRSGTWHGGRGACLRHAAGSEGTGGEHGGRFPRARL